jgi:hypothetical protein
VVCLSDVVFEDFKKAGVEGPPKTGNTHPTKRQHTIQCSARLSRVCAVCACVACGGVVMANEPSGVPPTLLWPALLMSHDELQAFRHTDDGRHVRCTHTGTISYIKGPDSMLCCV